VDTLAGSSKPPGNPQLKPKKASTAREALIKQKSRKEIMPGEKLTYEKIKNFDEAEKLRR
jgi:hypothetical protein